MLLALIAGAIGVVVLLQFVRETRALIPAPRPAEYHDDHSYRE